jgi:multicomponent Na+:H+ antiporter subunit D
VNGTAQLLLPVLVAGPILVACLLVAVGTVLPRRVVDALATATALGVTGAAALLLVLTDPGRTVAWFGGWQPTHRISVGIPFVADSVGAGLALLIGGLTSCALVYAWHYFDEGGSHFHALMLFFLAGMEGFVLSGDLFDMFVFFEVMGAAAYALTGIKIEDETAVQGGLNFGIVNSLGAYLSLTGIGLLYARVGQLGLPQLGDALSHKPPDALVVASFVLIATGFLVKGAVVPFHFWLADAHAVAPAPVCVLFSGAMVELGLYGVTRVYWVVYGETIPYDDIRRALLVAGVVTAVIGALMCFGQRHLKRLLAFSTIAHIGLFTMALATLSSDGTGGAAIYVLGHAGVKSALFLVAGALLNRYGSVDELELYGRARKERVLAVLFFAAALGLAGLPPFGTALGKSISEDATITAGIPWAPAVFVLVSAITAGAVLRVGLRVFLGLGPEPDEEQTSSQEETRGEEDRETPRLARTPVTMLAAIVVLLLGGLAVGVVPHGGQAVAHAAERFMDGADYADQALQASLPSTPLAPEPKATWSALGVGLGVLSTLLALGFAAIGLWPDRLRLVLRPFEAAMTHLRRLHTGHVGDYVAWLFAGVAALAALVGLPLL